MYILVLLSRFRTQACTAPWISPRSRRYSDGHLQGDAGVVGDGSHFYCAGFLLLLWWWSCLNVVEAQDFIYPARKSCCCHGQLKAAACWSTYQHFTWSDFGTIPILMYRYECQLQIHEYYKKESKWNWPEVFPTEARGSSTSPVSIYFLNFYSL